MADPMDIIRNQIDQLQQQLDNLGNQNQGQAPVANPPAIRFKPDQPANYSGNRSESLTSWLFQMERYFQLCEIPGETHVAFASTFLKNHAVIWWQTICEQLENQPEDDHWRLFREGLQAQFEPVNATKTARARLDQLKQKTSVLMYNTEFRQLILQLPNMHEEDRIHAYLKGLKPHVAQQVAMHQPNNLLEAQNLADTSDLIQFPFRPRTQHQERRPARYDNHGPAPMDLDAIGKLTDTERERLCKNGGCFGCCKTGHLACDCPLTNQQHPRINAIEEESDALGKE